MSNHPMFRRSLRACILLAALAWGTIAFCGDIHDAARDGNLDKIKALVQANPKLVSSKDEQGRTPLHWAAAGGHKEIVQFLLDNKADARARDNDGETPLDLASFHKDIADLLRASGGAGKKTTSHDPDILEAAGDGDMAKVKALIEDDPDAVFYKRPDYGATALDCAAMSGRKDVAEYLLDHKSDIESKNNQCETPLMDAAGNGHADVVKLLLDRGAKVNAVASYGADPDKPYGMTALHFAAMGGHKDVVDLLLAAKASVKAMDEDGGTPLHFAARWGFKDVAGSLVAGGADVNARNSYGQAPLHEAAMNDRMEVVDFLLSKGADVNAKDKKGRTPLRDAMDEGMKGMHVADLLAKHGGTQ